jgi:hypothetical protein
MDVVGLKSYGFCITRLASPLKDPTGRGVRLEFWDGILRTGFILVCIWLTGFMALEWDSGGGFVVIDTCHAYYLPPQL